MASKLSSRQRPRWRTVPMSSPATRRGARASDGTRVVSSNGTTIPRRSGAPASNAPGSRTVEASRAPSRREDDPMREELAAIDDDLRVLAVHVEMLRSQLDALRVATESTRDHDPGGAARG